VNYTNPDPLPPVEPAAAQPSVDLRPAAESAPAPIPAPAIHAPAAALASGASGADISRRELPPDLRVPWGWRDLLWFLLFAVISNFVLGALVELAAIAFFHAPKPTPQGGAEVNPAVVIVAQALWFIAALVYLRAVLSVRTAEPFWRSIGWRELPWQEQARGAVALRFLGGGAVMAVVVSLLGQLTRQKGELPIEQLLDTRGHVILLMALGLLAAPLVEETIFRGFLYPLIARQFGVAVGIVVTGLIFGAMHGPQLWPDYTQIGLMMVVGMVLTWVRARTGTVAASFLVHFGYNGLLFAGFLLETGGLRHFTPGG
jgi:membrane protease YdiL (CAAX protease family)